MNPLAQDGPSQLPTVVVAIRAAEGGMKEYTFRAPFKIGRAEDCEVSIKDDFVSRHHASVAIENGVWWLTDLNSSNGVFVNHQRVQRVPLGNGLGIRLGEKGPQVALRVVQPAVEPAKPVAATKVINYAEHYFGKGNSETPAGEHTMFIRTAFAEVQKKQKRKYGWVIAALAVVMACLGGFALYQYHEAGKQRTVATNIFYSMKSLDVDIANLQGAVEGSNNPQAIAQLQRIEAQRKQMQSNYDQYLASLHVYNSKMSPQDKLILRVARIFGECELDVPPGFVAEVHKYIGYWQSSDRLANAITRAEANQYNVTIPRDLLAQGLPPQFFYLALQESNFDSYTSGPPTRKGIAKGMWQFIPETAVKYGLHVGPLADQPRPDPQDDRDHYDLETVAAARYLKDLYGSDAQGSGLLMMACYNWGEDYVLPLVRTMPMNPRDRNFWKLLEQHRAQIPQQTYDYVFYIFSAAVIGENPRLFGFHFDNPLANLDSQSSVSTRPGAKMRRASARVKRHAATPLHG